MIDLKKQVFGDLKVIERNPPRGHAAHWICECRCGNHVIVRSDNLRCGRTTRCSDCRGGAGVESVFLDNKEGDNNGAV